MLLGWQGWLLEGQVGVQETGNWAQSGTGSVTCHLPSQGHGDLRSQLDMPGPGPRSHWRGRWMVFLSPQWALMAQVLRELHQLPALS